MSEHVWTWANILIFAVIAAASLIVLCGVWLDRRSKRAALMRIQIEVELSPANPYRQSSMTAMQDETAKRFVTLFSESKNSDG